MAAASPYHHDVPLDHNDDDAGYADGDIPASAAQWLGILAGPSAKVLGWRLWVLKGQRVLNMR